MPRSSFSDNPLLRVSRPVSACSRCRSAKVKCDGKLPACTACEKAGREDECSSANDQFARGKERSYVAALELRIEKLERRLAYAKSRKASVAQHETDTSLDVEPERKDSLANIKAAIQRKAARKRENSDVNSLMSDFGTLSINATTRDFEPSITNMTFARLVLAAACNDPLPAPLGTRLPPRQTSLSLIQYYMTNIYALYPSFQETTLYTVLDQLYVTNDSRPVSDSEYWLVHMVLAIGSTAQSKSYNDDFYRNGRDYVARAMQVADRALSPGRISQIQSLVLLTQYAMLDPTHFDSWHLVGVTCRSAVDLGFHQDPPPEQLSDKEALDMRRKIFYCVYCLDRTISMAHARAFSFTDAATNVAFPRPTSFSRRASITGTMLSGSEPAFLLFQLRRAQSHWYQALFQSNPTPLSDATSFLWQMCQDMREWGSSLPPTLPVGMRELFDLELRYSYVYCLAPSNRAPNMTDYSRQLVFEHSLAYLDKMFEIAHSNFNTAFYNYHDALRVYFMGSQLSAVLRAAWDLLLSGHYQPPPPPIPGKAMAPPLPSRPPGSVGDNLDRSLRCLERVTQTLRKYGERWASSMMLMETFNAMSNDLVQRLRMQREVRDRQSTSPPAQQMRWVGVNVEDMMRGNMGGRQ